MLTAFSQAGINCYAWVTEKNEDPFFCKGCMEEVVLRKGSIRAHHFAHRSPVTCQYGRGETELHYRAKKEIYESLIRNENCTYCELEKKINNVITDIYAVINGCEVAIEIQKSNLTVNDVAERTIERYNNRLSVLWIIPSLEKLKIFRDDYKEVARVPKWMEFLHALSFGRLYVWSENGASVIPIHLEKVLRHVHYDEVYNSYGEYMTVGGYNKRLKDRKEIVKYPHGLIKIANDFNQKLREQFSTKHYTLPRCLLWQDSYRRWW